MGVDQPRDQRIFPPAVVLQTLRRAPCTVREHSHHLALRLIDEADAVSIDGPSRSPMREHRQYALVEHSHRLPDMNSLASAEVRKERPPHRLRSFPATWQGRPIFGKRVPQDLERFCQRPAQRVCWAIHGTLGR